MTDHHDPMQPEHSQGQGVPAPGGATPPPMPPMGGGGAPYAQAGGIEPQRRGGKRPWIIGGAAALALALGGGAFAAQRAGLFGAGGPTPDTVVPASAVGYVRFDSNPDAGQKVAAFRLANKLPEVKDAVASKDWRKAAFDTIKESAGSGELKDVDYDKDIKPWLGDRGAAAAYLPSEGAELVPMVVLQVKDEAKAREGLNKLHLDESNTDLRFKDGYAIFTAEDKGDQTIKAVEAGTLSSSSDFTSDMRDLGSDGIASMWIDLKGFAKSDLKSFGDAASSSTRTSSADGAQLESLKTQLGKSGRVSAALRFDSDFVELAGITRGAEQAAGSVADGRVELGNLPADTIGAIGIADGEKSIKAQWPELVKQFDSTMKSQDPSASSAQDMISQAESALGISLPDDLAVLFGKQAVLAVGDMDYTSIGAGNLPKVGFRSETDATKAKEVTQKLLDFYAQQQGGSASDVPLKLGSDSNTFTIGLDESYRQALASGGKLGDDEGFTKAMADSKPTTGMYLSLDRIEKYYLDQVPSDRKDFVQAMRGIGLSTTQEGAGKASFSLRLVAN